MLCFFTSPYLPTFLIYASTDFSFLPTPSALDRYPVLMTNRIMTAISIISWMAAHLGPGVGAVNYAQLVPYCKSNKILHIYCDMVSLVLLSCGDISTIVLKSTSMAMLVLLGPLSLIILSYACVIVTVMKMATLQVRESVCVCVGGRERERDRDRGKERGKGRERQSGAERGRVQ